MKIQNFIKLAIVNTISEIKCNNCNNQGNFDYFVSCHKCNIYFCPNCSNSKKHKFKL